MRLAYQRLDLFVVLFGGLKRFDVLFNNGLVLLARLELVMQDF